MIGDRAGLIRACFFVLLISCLLIGGYGEARAEQALIRADAGRDQVVRAGALVRLDGRDSISLSGDELQFSWRQIDGPAVELAGSDGATPSFLAVDGDKAYIFNLTVSDNSGGLATDTIVVATRAIDGDNQGLMFGLTAIGGGLLLVVAIGLAISLRKKIRPAYGLVRDGKSRQPLDLAVVRVFETETGKLLSTRVTDKKGRFYDLPKAGIYNVTVTREGYQNFINRRLVIARRPSFRARIRVDMQLAKL